MFETFFEVFYSLLVEGSLQHIRDPLPSTRGYQLLSLATSQLMGNNREFNVSSILGVLLIVGGRELMAIKDLSLSVLGY